MFSRKDCRFFLAAGLLILTAFMLMAFDPEENGFGIATLWIAPPLLLAGFLLPAFGISRPRTDFVRGFLENTVLYTVGIFVFLITFVVYLCTLEPTASLWDCSEFIASAFKLQVPHTPGTPLSLLIGRVFTMFAFGDNKAVAWTLNLMSGLFSALTVYLLFLIIHHLGRQASGNSKHGRVIVMFAAAVGSLCLAFSDTFWFSAVEAETYGTACFFLLLLVFLILTGRSLDEPRKSRRLILIGYLAGLSYCIHPMCLLALTILPFAWIAYQRRFTVGIVLLLIGAGLIIVFLINRLIAIGFFELVYTADLFVVNTLHLPFYSGAVIVALVLAAVFRQILEKYRQARPVVWSVIFLMAGFLPYVVLFIRSNHNPPIDETNPENLAMIKAYMNRESYPSVPVLYGPYFDAQVQDIRAKKKIFYKDDQAYRFAGTMPEYVYGSRQTLLPRMYSNEARDIETYRSWTGLGENEKPTFFDNLQFLFTYQLGHMYFRYFMWNFSGRAGDIQHSDWLRPWEWQKSNPFEKAQNQYWMLPLLFGIAGAVFQYRRDRNGFIVVAIFLAMTGFVLALYLNAPPNEPRERDYIYVGSFIAYCIWIGFGVMALGQVLGGIRERFRLVILLTPCLPAWMLYQNYDDHDRSGRTFQVDNARNTLNACAPNSILFTGGDNDTFPLWYLQEVEGFRTDVRVMVMSYLNTDWYINQLRKKYYKSGAFRFTLDENDYRQYGPNDVLYVNERIKTPIDVRRFFSLLKEGHPALRMTSRNGDPYHILPSRKLLLKVPVSEPNDSLPGDSTGNDIGLEISEDYVSKNLLAIFDILISNGWERPIHFNFTSLNTLGADVSQYVVQEGPVFRLRPERNTSGTVAVDLEKSYQNIIVNADYSNLKDPSVHFSYEDHFVRGIVPVRQAFNELAAALFNDGRQDEASAVLHVAVDNLYGAHLPPSYTNLEAAEILFALNEKGYAHALSRAVFDFYVPDIAANNKRLPELDLYLLRRSADLLARGGQPGYREQLERMGI